MLNKLLDWLECNKYKILYKELKEEHQQLIDAINTLYKNQKHIIELIKEKKTHKINVVK